MNKYRPLPLILSVTVICFGCVAYAQIREPADPQKLRELCETILCRETLSVRLMLKDGKPFEMKFDIPVPIVQNNWVSVFPGDTLFIEADVQDNRLVNLRAVSQNKNPEKTLELRFWQEAGKLNMFLFVKNPFPKLVKYHAVMMLPAGDQMYKTSSCPVLSQGRGAYELWPHPIFQLTLFDLRLVDEQKDGTRCEF